MTAIVSGVSIYVNAHAVKHFGNATVYTTAKNAVAGLLLLALAVVPLRVASGAPAAAPPRSTRQWLARLGVAVVGGSVPFVLFFEGLARAQATQASFIQKTLVVWVALLAVPLLRERFRAPHALAVCLLIGGQAWLAGSAGHVVFGEGEAMIFVATLLWAIESCTSSAC
jgi:drug/metabolite transporter (DMT)-like permease